MTYGTVRYTPRGVLHPFEFAGFHAEAGEEAIIVHGLTHFLPQFIPDPWYFDVERYFAPCKELRQGLGFFAPYTYVFRR